jgi:hypothetical protein
MPARPAITSVIRVPALQRRIYILMRARKIRLFVPTGTNEQRCCTYPEKTKKMVYLLGAKNSTNEDAETLATYSATPNFSGQSRYMPEILRPLGLSNALGPLALRSLHMKLLRYTEDCKACMHC